MKFYLSATSWLCVIESDNCKKARKESLRTTKRSENQISREIGKKEEKRFPLTSIPQRGQGSGAS